MAISPKLLLRLDPNGFAMSGRCPMCAELIDLGPVRVAHKEYATQQLEDEFRIHLLRKHSQGEDLNQAEMH